MTENTPNNHFANRFDPHCCHGCGRQFASLEVTFVGEDTAGQTLAVGMCCKGRLVRLRGYGMFVASDEPEENVERVRQALAPAILGIGPIMGSAADMARMFPDVAGSIKLRKTEPPKENAPDLGDAEPAGNA